MTYKNVLGDFFGIIANHKMIKTSGYGPLSEIKVPRGQYDTNYPYAFLQPTNHSMSKGASTFRFNLIMMEMTNDDIDSVIEAQSQCYEYVKDILGHFYYHLDNYDFNLNVSVIPFKEKYDDVVSGVTATIELTVRDLLNDCIAPFADERGNLYIDVVQNLAQTVDPDSGVPFGDVFRFTTEIVDVDGAWNVLRMDTVTPGTYSFEMEYSFQFENAPGVTAPPILSYRPTGLPTQYIDATTIEGWPSVPQAGVTYNIKQTWNFIDMIVPSSVYMQYYNTPANEIALLVEEGASLKIYKTA